MGIKIKELEEIKLPLNPNDYAQQRYDLVIADMMVVINNINDRLSALECKIYTTK